jgi:hypothetical protein
MSEMLTPGEAARELHMSPSRLRAITDEGSVFSCRTPGGHRRYPRSEIERIRDLFMRACPPSPSLTVSSEAGSLESELMGLWEHAINWVDQQCRPLAHREFAKLADPGCELVDEAHYACLRFHLPLPDGLTHPCPEIRYRPCRFHWPELVKLLADHQRTGESLYDMCQPYFPHHPYLLPDDLKLPAICNHWPDGSVRSQP